jgi:hypothetical protein
MKPTLFNRFYALNPLEIPGLYNHVFGNGKIRKTSVNQGKYYKHEGATKWLAQLIKIIFRPKRRGFMTRLLKKIHAEWAL